MKVRLPEITKQHLSGGFAPRPASLKGLRVGFLDGWGDKDGNRMYPAMAVIERRLKEEYGVADTIWQKKPSISQRVPDSIMREFINKVDVVINGEGLCGSCTAGSILDGVELEAMGKPSVTIVQDRFEKAARAHARNLGLPDLFLLVEKAPVTGSIQHDVEATVNGNWQEIIKALTDDSRLSAGAEQAVAARSRVVEIAEAEEWDDLVEANKWSDGLPVAIPSEKTVQGILDYLNRDASDVIGLIPPTYGIATVEQVVIQCAMAGCRPEYVPIVIAALEAMLEPEFNLHGSLCTTNPGAPQVIVSGPIVDELDFNTANCAFGGSGRANGAIGRAVRLIARNIGGADATVNDMDPLGGAQKYAACVAEDRGRNPLGSINTDRGFDPDENIVTVFKCPAPYPAVTNGSAERILAQLAEGFSTSTVPMFHAGGQALFTLSIKPARTLAEAGYGRDEIRQYILEHAYLTPRQLKDAGVMKGPFTDVSQIYYGENSVEHLRIEVETAADDARLPLFASIDDVQLLITGGDTQFFSAFQPGWGGYGGGFVSRRIDRSGVRDIVGESMEIAS